MAVPVAGAASEAGRVGQPRTWEYELSTTEKAVIAAACNLAWVNVDDITGTTNLESDLGFDSIQKAELLLNLEREHGITLTARERLATVNDVAAAIDAAKRAG